jgi:hypothetical protein
LRAGLASLPTGAAVRPTAAAGPLLLVVRARIRHDGRDPDRCVCANGDDEHGDPEGGEWAEQAPCRGFASPHVARDWLGQLGHEPFGDRSQLFPDLAVGRNVFRVCPTHLARDLAACRVRARRCQPQLVRDLAARRICAFGPPHHQSHPGRRKPGDRQRVRPAVQPGLDNLQPARPWLDRVGCRVQRLTEPLVLGRAHTSRSSTVRSACMALAVWLLTAPRLICMASAICASDISP